MKEVFLEISQKSKENTRARVSFLIKLQAEACNFITKEAVAQVFSCEFCKISENTIYYRPPQTYFEPSQTSMTKLLCKNS